MRFDDSMWRNEAMNGRKFEWTYRKSIVFNAFVFISIRVLTTRASNDYNTNPWSTSFKMARSILMILCIENEASNETKFE
jgi:hypothetical protein